MKHAFSIMKNSYLRLGIGLIILILSGLSFFLDLRFSEEFTGGVKITVASNLEGTNIQSDLKDFLTSKLYKDFEIQINPGIEISKISLKAKVENDEKVNILSKDIQGFLIENKYVNDAKGILEQSVTGPSVGSYMQSTAVKALVIGLIFMAIYMMFSFSAIRKEIAPGVLALVVIVTMIFDVMVPAGGYGILMRLNKTIAVDTVFIIAVLTNMGYSINDTIIIFDRVRENMQKKAGQKGFLFGKVFEDSLRQTMRRSFGTVFATFLVILTMYILGAGVIKQFAFTIGIGVIAGSYSSIFISAPLAYILLGKYKKERKQLLELKD